MAVKSISSCCRAARIVLLACRDEDVTLKMAFEESSIQWVLTNRGKDPLNFQLALSPHVHVPDALTAGRVTVARGNVSLSFEGFDSLTNTPTGALLISQIKPGSGKTLSVK